VFCPAAEYTTLRVCFIFVMALFFGTAFWQMGERNSNRNDIYTIMGAIFMLCASQQPARSVSRQCCSVSSVCCCS
jgi:hypothetical protein